jgi:hypothetical protein
MEIKVTRDYQLFDKFGTPFKKGTILFFREDPPLAPCLDMQSTNITVRTIRSDRWFLWETVPMIGICGEKIWYITGNSLLDYSTKVCDWNLTLVQQMFVIKYRPDLIGQISGLYPELRNMFKHESNLAGIEI